MASHAAMLLDPKAYKKQMKSNGNDPENPPGSPYPDSDTRSEAQEAFFPSSRRCPSPPEDPMSLDDTDSLIDTADRSESGKSSQSNTRSPVAPAGTSSTAQRFHSPQRRRPPSVQPSPKSRSRLQSLESHTNSATSSPQPSEKTEPEVDFTFTSAQSDDEHDTKRGCDHLEPEANLRHGNLIENMYGVERRANPPYKKVKMKEEQDGPIKKGNFASAGDSGLGKWMKEDQSTPDTSLPVTPDVVDLTLDAPATTDDDDLQVTGSNNLSIQRVCYGKIENARVQAILVPRPATQTIFGDPNVSWPSMKLGVHRDANQKNIRIDVSDPHGKIFGAIEARIAAVIAPLLDSPGLKVDITARLDYRQRKPDEFPWSCCSEFFRASINLYGLRKDAELVGNHLGQNNVWLGTPFSVEQGVPVFNPHTEKRRAQANFLPALAARGRSSVSYEVRSAEEVNNAVMKMFDQLQSAENLPEIDTPSLLKTPLLRHQKQALWFMTEKEKPRKFGPKEEENNSLWRIEYSASGKRKYREIISGLTMDEEPPQTLGGLLADMMGLGKTLSILSLVVSSLDEARNWAPLPPPTDMVKEIPGIRNSKVTLLVVPLSAVNNWVLQIKDHLKTKAVSYYVFHGSGRTNSVEELSQYDLVITTYSIVLSELSGRGAKRGVSPLTKMNMFRIVLDEAHTIREQTAAQTQAIFRLNSQRKWSVTGTPIQNRLEDLLSVTKFLGLVPYNDRSNFTMHILSRFKTGDATVLASLRVLVDSFTLRRVKDKIDIPARHDQILVLKFSDKEKQLHDFFRNESNVMMKVIAGEDQAKMKGRMYHHILKAMMILRQISAHGKELLDAADRERIKGLSVQDAINLEEGGDSDAPDVSFKKAYEMFVLMQESSADTCALCNKRLEEPSSDSGPVGRQTPIAIVLPCYDVLCPDCFSGWKHAFDTKGVTLLPDIKCQVCDGWIPASYVSITVGGLQDHMVEQAQAKQNRRQSKILGEYEGPHTKTTALIEQLQATAEESQKLKDQDQRPLKSVVFSAWTSHLDLIEIALKDNNITGFVRLDGTMTLAARGKALKEFHSNDRITVLLATIGAGGVGLNLTAASKVYIMEPQYNPAAVAQAVDRVHRIGQTREVTTVQFIMKDSIEEKIFELAKKKQQLADLSLNRGKLDKKEVQEQRMRDYRGLFK